MSQEKKNARTSSEKSANTERLYGGKLHFAATEAYKLLRTNLFFCIPSAESAACPVVGVTSSVQGEGKSTTSINLAYMLAENGKKVCLIEGDMRAPTMTKRLALEPTAGLSKALAGMAMPTDSMVSALHENLKILPAGEMPPNPAELLGSDRMANLAKTLREMFDYVILDLPPVTVVADALAVSGTLDGMIVVVEEGVTTKHELADAMQRLDVIKDKILGFVVTRAGENDRKYGYGKKKYGYRYGYGYGYGYRKREDDDK